MYYGFPVGKHHFVKDSFSHRPTAPFPGARTRCGRFIGAAWVRAEPSELNPCRQCEKLRLAHKFRS